MRNRILPLLIALALVLTALPVTNATAVTTATNYDQFVDYINTYGFEDEDGVMTLLDYYEDTENSMDFYFLAQDWGTSICLQLVVLGYAEAGVDSSTAILLERDSSDIYTEISMLLFYGEEYIDAAEQSDVLDRSAYTLGQELTVDQESTYISAADASEYYTVTMNTLCAYWDECLYYELGFGLKGLGFTAYDGYGSAVCDIPSGYHTGNTEVVGQKAPTCVADGYTGDIRCADCGILLSTGATVSNPDAHVYDGTTCILCGHSSVIGCSISGRVDSVGEGNATVTLTDGRGVEYTAFVTDSFTFTDIAPGTYTLTVSKDRHVTRTYTIAVEADATQNVSICLAGDTNGDGKLNMKDWSAIYDHTSEVAPLAGYALECADVNGDGKVNLKDWARLYDHISETDPLW